MQSVSKFAREKKTYAIRELAAAKKKDIKLKVVKSELQDFQFISNFISLFPFSWVFFPFLTIDSHSCASFSSVWSCSSFSHIYTLSSLSSAIISLERKKVWEWKRNRRKTNKIIYCLSICVIFFSITIRTFQLFFSSVQLCFLSPFFIGSKLNFYRNEPINVSWLWIFSFAGACNFPFSVCKAKRRQKWNVAVCTTFSDLSTCYTHSPFILNLA